MYAGFQRVDRTDTVRGVIRADTDGVELFLFQHGLVVRIKMNVCDAITRGKLFGFPGDQVGQRNDFHVIHLQIAFRMGFGDPSGSDNADFELAVVVRLRAFFIGTEFA